MYIHIYIYRYYRCTYIYIYILYKCMYSFSGAKYSPNSLHHVKKSGLLFLKEHSTGPASFSQC